MEKVLLYIISAAVQFSVSSLAEHQFHYVDTPKNWTEAQRYCRENFRNLAIIDNMEDVDILNKVAGSRTNTFWIGLYDDVNSWRWSMSDENFYQRGEADFRIWENGEPNNEHGVEKCAAMKSNGSWNDVPCNLTLKPMCFDIRGTNVSFVNNSNDMTWTEAQSYCREHHTDLASVRNTAENQKINMMIPSGQRVWIGLFRDSWKWVDGRSSSVEYWRESEPNNAAPQENCAVANFGNSGRWEDWNCDEKFAFICRSDIPVKQVFRLKLQRNSNVDLNNATVLENLLKQLKQKLKDQRVTGDIKLSWKKKPDRKVFHKVEENDEL